MVVARQTQVAELTERFPDQSVLLVEYGGVVATPVTNVSTPLLSKYTTAAPLGTTPLTGTPGNYAVKGKFRRNSVDTPNVSGCRLILLQKMEGQGLTRNPGSCNTVGIPFPHLQHAVRRTAEGFAATSTQRNYTQGLF